MEFVRGRGWPARAADRVATSLFRWIYTRAPLAPRSFTKVAKTNGVPPLRTVASLLTADRNLLTEMPWELDGFRIPPGFERIGPIFAHIDAPAPADRRRAGLGIRAPDLPRTRLLRRSRTRAGGGAGAR